MTALRRCGLALLVALAMALPLAVPASAQEGAPITRYYIDVNLTPDGDAQVRIDFTMDFSSQRGRGPYVLLVTRQEDGANPDEWYVYEYSDIQVTSETGARTDISTSNNERAKRLRIGDEDVFYDTPQQYTVSYTVRGLIVSDHPQSGLDEFNWNAIGRGWESDMRDVQVNLTGPAEVQQSACFTGTSFDQECQHSATGSSATYSLDVLEAGQPMQIVAGFEPGTFGGVEQIKERRVSAANSFELTPATGATTGLLGLAAIALLVVLGRRHARDEVYLGLTPGLTPRDGHNGAVGPAAPKREPTVQFHPPKGATAGEIGTLIDTWANDTDIAATIVDLAVRGYMRIEPMDAKQNRLVRLTQDTNGLQPYERKLLNGLFKHGPSVTTNELKHERYERLMPDAKSDLYEAMKHRKWFKGNPNVAMMAPILSGMALIVIAVAAALFLAGWGWSLVAIPVAILGVGLLVLSPRFRTRTAAGSAALAQARGFELYLSKAEADQIKFEEGVDIFSRYLPYAMIFGVADRWARVFAELGAQGRYTADLSWYPGMSLHNYYFFSNSLTHMGQGMSEALNSAMASGMASSTSGSSGMSGFSGGGGFGGGGGGSW